MSEPALSADGWLDLMEQPTSALRSQLVTVRLLKLWRRREADARLLVVETDDDGAPLALRAVQ